jgi:predicted RNA-binding protein with PUA-like domain
MNYWLMKSEPKEFSIDDLRRKKRSFWDGIRNYQVRNMLRDDFKMGDRALFYHSNLGEYIGVVGVMEVVKEAYPDHTQFEPTSKYYDAKSTIDNPRWLGVEVQFIEKLPNLVPLAALKAEKSLSELPVVKKGNRLSVVRLTKAQFEMIVKMSKK